MTPERFIEIFNNRQLVSRAVLAAKAVEYSRHGDRLHNFKVAARIKACTPLQAAFDMYLKHLVSVMDMVEDSSCGIIISPYVLEEKIGDSINYHHLFEALIIEANTAREKGL